MIKNWKKIILSQKKFKMIANINSGVIFSVLPMNAIFIAISSYKGVVG